MNGDGRTSTYNPSPMRRRQRCRISFSCTNCRHSKQKCDRQKPCASCIRRGRRNTCRYEEAIFDYKSSFEKNLEVKPPRLLLPAYGEPTIPETTPYALRSETSSVQALDHLGYSNVNDHNALGIFKKLAQLEIGLDKGTLEQHDGEIRLTPAILEKYLHLLRLLPSRPYLDAILEIFFSEVGWQYSLVDSTIFADRLNVFYKSSYDKIVKDQSLSPESLSFPSLLFQMIALSLQFLPPDYNPSLDALCMGSSFDHLAEEYSNSGVAVSALFEKDKLNFVAVQASFLRVCWLKNAGRVTESWLLLGQTIMDAKEIGLHRVDGKIDFHDTDVTCSQLWAMEDRRRIWLNLFLWDSEMGMVLGKPLNINLRDCIICPPIDTKVIENLKTTAPFPRAESDKPTSFTQRLIEYRLQIYLPKIRELELEGPFPKDYSRVQRLHQEALTYMDTMPAIYRLENPDRSFDAECPWLPPQREYLCTVTWYFILALHKPYAFTIPESRKEIIRAGIEMLKAQQREFECLKQHHYKLFTLTYLTVEAAVAVLAVLIAYPGDNGEPGKEAFRCIRESVARLRVIHKKSNALAGTGADVIQVLLNRVETAKIFPAPGLEITPIVVGSSSKPNSANTINSVVVQDSLLYTAHHTGYSDSVAADSISDSSNFPSLNPQDMILSSSSIPSGYEDQSPPDSLLSGMDSIIDPIAADYENLFAPLQPAADLMFHDLAPAFDVASIENQDLDLQMAEQHFGTSSEEIRQQFTGDFADNSFWGFLNQGL
ncbi:hypothetical protein F5884DRAFT_806443 [Xylogone sp. PMI_703]|nr:hypothetical protein F5884DRAFT_806443 [Xylogone sp. PMI_703]